MLRFNRINLKSDRRGIALITVLIIMLVMTILTTGVVVISVSNLNQTKTTLDHKQSFYVAEAGVNYLVNKLESKIDVMIANNTPVGSIMSSIKSWIETTDEDVVHQDLDLENAQSGNFDAYTTVDEAAQTIVIRSTGSVKGVTRTLVKTISMGGISINRAILTEGLLNVGKDDVFSNDSLAKVGDGEVQTLTTGPSSFIFDSNAQIGVLYIPSPIPPTTIQQVVPGCTSIVSIGVNEYKCTFNGTKDNEILIRVDDTGITALPKVTMPSTNASTSSPKLPAYTNTIYYKSGNKYLQKLATTPYIDGNGNITVNQTTFGSEISYLASLPSPTYILSFPTSSNVFYVPNFNIESTIPGFTIDVGSRNIEVYTDKLNLGGTFNIKGTGTLTVFINAGSNLSDSFTYTQNTTIGAYKEGTATEQKVANKFILAINGTTGSELVFRGNTTFYLSIITNLNLNFDTGGNITYNGFLATSAESVKFQGSAAGNMLLYAPEGNVSISGSVNMMGAIYSKSYISTTNGNAVEIRYDSDYANSPFAFLHPLNNLYFGSTVEE